MKPKKDTSTRVHQRDKLKGQLDLRPLNWTEKQKKFLELASDKKTRIIFISGPAGSSKTLLAVYSALQLLNEQRVSDVLYIRSAVESSDSKLGYLPGELSDKMSYYGIPFLDKLEELLPKQQIEWLTKENRVSVQPVNFIRGQSWNARVAVIDEAQNMTQKEIFTILTRVGKFSKAFVMADPTQSDIHMKSGGFERLAQHLCNSEGEENGIYHFEFGVEDIMRDELTKFLVRRYGELH